MLCGESRIYRDNVKPGRAKHGKHRTFGGRWKGLWTLKLIERVSKSIIWECLFFNRRSCCCCRQRRERGSSCRCGSRSVASISYFGLILTHILAEKFRLLVLVRCEESRRRNLSIAMETQPTIYMMGKHRGCNVILSGEGVRRLPLRWNNYSFHWNFNAHLL